MSAAVWSRHEHRFASRRPPPAADDLGEARPCDDLRQRRLMHEVGSASGIVIAEDGPRVLVVDRRIAGLAVARFVLGLIGGIGLANGLLWLGLSGSGSDVPAVLGPILAVVALPPLAGAIVVHRRIRARRATPLAELSPVAVFDRSARTVADATGAVVGRLDQVEVRRQLNIGSSSPRLVAVLPDRTLRLGTPNPFAGGLGSLHLLLAEVLAEDRPR